MFSQALEMLDLASYLSSQSAPSVAVSTCLLKPPSNIEQSHILYNVPREMPMFAFSVSSLKVQWLFFHRLYAAR